MISRVIGFGSAAFASCCSMSASMPGAIEKKPCMPESGIGRGSARGFTHSHAHRSRRKSPFQRLNGIGPDASDRGSKRVRNPGRGLSGLALLNDGPERALAGWNKHRVDGSPPTREPLSYGLLRDDCDFCPLDERARLAADSELLERHQILAIPVMGRAPSPEMRPQLLFRRRNPRIVAFEVTQT